MFTKKGVSPIIATVLIMVIVITLGAGVMNWSKIFVKEKLDSATDANAEFICSSELNLEVLKIGNERQFKYCTTAQEIRYTVTNKGTDGQIEQIVWTVIGEDQTTGEILVFEQTNADIIAAGSTVSSVITGYDPAVNGDILKVTGVPFYLPSSADTPIACSDTTIEFENVRVDTNC